MPARELPYPPWPRLPAAARPVRTAAARSCRSDYYFAGKKSIQKPLQALMIDHILESVHGPVIKK